MRLIFGDSISHTDFGVPRFSLSATGASSTSRLDAGVMRSSTTTRPDDRAEVPREG
jgi:hypothetical protein